MFESLKKACIMGLQPLHVATPGGTYPVLVGPGLQRTLPEQLDALNLRGALWLISDSEVYPRYGATIETLLRDAGYAIQGRAIPSGEASKELSVAGQLYDWLIGGRVERRDAVLALGGGVVGDLAGFVAATVLRGITLIQLPTTLLAMVDSAIGGKTGVNHALGKNLIGAFHQPRLVLSDTDTLATLPEREVCAGMAEVIKHGVIYDAGLFEELEYRRLEMRDWRLGSADLQSLISSLVWRAARVKVDIVSADERESGERMLLNYGHTLGHALEAALGYGTLLHGEAVAIGMQLAARIAERLGLFDAASVERQRQLLHAYGLSTSIPAGVDSAHLLELVMRDKKVRAGRLHWVLPTRIGAVETRDDVPEVLVRAVLEDAV